MKKPLLGWTWHILKAFQDFLLIKTYFFLSLIFMDFRGLGTEIERKKCSEVKIEECPVRCVWSCCRVHQYISTSVHQYIRTSVHQYISITWAARQAGQLLAWCSWVGGRGGAQGRDTVCHSNGVITCSTIQVITSKLLLNFHTLRNQRKCSLLLNGLVHLGLGGVPRVQ